MEEARIDYQDESVTELAPETAAAGGSFPVRVRGAGVVAAVTVSGLTSDEDHDFVVAALERYGTPA